MHHSPQQIRGAEAALKRRLQTGCLRYHYRGLGFLFQGRETIPARMVVSASVDTTRGTSPLQTRCINDNRHGFNARPRTSHARHWIIVSLSHFGSYGRPHRQKMPLKFWPYEFSLFSSSRLRCKVHPCGIAVVGQSHRKLRLGNNSICS